MLIHAKATPKATPGTITTERAYNMSDRYKDTGGKIPSGGFMSTIGDIRLGTHLVHGDPPQFADIIPGGVVCRGCRMEFYSSEPGTAHGMFYQHVCSDG